MPVDAEQPATTGIEHTPRQSRTDTGGAQLPTGGPQAANVVGITDQTDRRYMTMTRTLNAN